MSRRWVLLTFHKNNSSACSGQDPTHHMIIVSLSQRRVRELRLCSIILIQKAFRQYTANGRFEEVVEQVDSKREAAQVSQL